MEYPLHRLVYVSQNRAGGLDGIASEVEAILAASRRNNVAAGVTGALIFNQGMFAQVLEGALHQVEATFERIQRDDRHGQVQVLALDAVAHRAFPNWSMAFIGRSREGQDLFGHLGAASGFEAPRLQGERVFAVMQAIALEEEARAA
jgi:hypothetical protein